MRRRAPWLTVRDMVLFALFGSVMYALVQIKAIPNFHPLALFIAALTVVYRFKALIPLYVYVMLEGFMSGFGIWWWPYLYIWTILWLFIMLIPKKIHEAVAAVLISVASALFGMGFGTFYSPFQCYVFLKGNWHMTWLWILNGLPFDGMHAVGNFASSLLVIPFVRLLCRLEGKTYPFKTWQRKRKTDRQAIPAGENGSDTL